jgi:hypothetical protein
LGKILGPVDENLGTKERKGKGNKERKGKGKPKKGKE